MIDQSRLDLTSPRTNPDRPRRKPLGRIFWRLYTAFLFFGPALAVIIIGQLIYTAATSDEPVQPPIPAAAEEAGPTPPVPAPPAEDSVYQDENGVWRNTKRGASPGPHLAKIDPAAAVAPQQPPVDRRPAPNLLGLGLSRLTGNLGLSNSTAITLDRPDRFYQDENGVWRNAPLEPGPASTAGSGSSGGALSGLPGSGQGGGLDALMSLMGSGQDGGGLDALMGLMGSGQGGGELSALMDLLGLGQGGGELSALMDLLGLGQGGGELPCLLNDLLSSTSPSGAARGFGAEEIAPMNITRARPQISDYQPSRASRITPGPEGLNLEGYERFDPARPGDIKSEWEFFDDPR